MRRPENAGTAPWVYVGLSHRGRHGVAIVMGPKYFGYG
jgi:hypothetical protein